MSNHRATIGIGSAFPYGDGYILWTNLETGSTQWKFFSTLGEFVNMLNPDMEFIVERFTEDGNMEFRVCIDPTEETVLDKLNAEFAEQFR
jgi:hypothetical protein